MYGLCCATLISPPPHVQALDIHPSSRKVAVAVSRRGASGQATPMRPQGACGSWRREEAAGFGFDVAAIEDWQCNDLKFMHDGHVLLAASGSKVQLLDADRLFVGAQFQSSSDSAEATGLALCGHSVFAAGAANWGMCMNWGLAEERIMLGTTHITLKLVLQCRAGNSEGVAHVWDLRQRRPVRCFQHSRPLKGERLQLCFSDKHSSLVLAGGSSFRVEDLRMARVRMRT